MHLLQRFVERLGDLVHGLLDAIKIAVVRAGDAHGHVAGGELGDGVAQLHEGLAERVMLAAGGHLHVGLAAGNGGGGVGHGALRGDHLAHRAGQLPHFVLLVEHDHVVGAANGEVAGHGGEHLHAPRELRVGELFRFHHQLHLRGGQLVEQYIDGIGLRANGAQLPTRLVVLLLEREGHHGVLLRAQRVELLTQFSGHSLLLRPHDLLFVGGEVRAEAGVEFHHVSLSLPDSLDVFIEDGVANGPRDRDQLHVRFLERQRRHCVPGVHVVEQSVGSARRPGAGTTNHQRKGDKNAEAKREFARDGEILEPLHDDSGTELHWGARMNPANRRSCPHKSRFVPRHPCR